MFIMLSLWLPKCNLLLDSKYLEVYETVQRQAFQNRPRTPKISHPAVGCCARAAALSRGSQLCAPLGLRPTADVFGRFFVSSTPPSFLAPGSLLLGLEDITSPLSITGHSFDYSTAPHHEQKPGACPRIHPQPSEQHQVSNYRVESRLTR